MKGLHNSIERDLDLASYTTFEEVCKLALKVEKRKPAPRFSSMSNTSGNTHTTPPATPTPAAVPQSAAIAQPKGSEPKTPWYCLELSSRNNVAALDVKGPAMLPLIVPLNEYWLLNRYAYGKKRPDSMIFKKHRTVLTLASIYSLWTFLPLINNYLSFVVYYMLPMLHQPHSEMLFFKADVLLVILCAG